MPTTIFRSYLFVPGNRPERFDKGCRAGADAVILDLEDAVPPAEKSQAREEVMKWLSPDKPVLVRINSADTEWFRDDIAVCSKPGVAGVMLAKAERVEDIDVIAQRVRVIVPLIETAQGFANAPALAQARSVQRLAFGSIDFQVDLGISGEWEELLFFRSQLVLASRLAGIQAPIDGVSTAIDDPDQVRADTLRGRRLGFGAKLCIHPKQVAPVNAGFRPTQEEVAWARRVLDAMVAAQGAAVSVDGKMVDRPVMLKAEQIINESKRHLS
jgi:citrate lyase subunit beta/citryl-CoA lyase